ncbi:MAG: hypothetical protein A2023_00095 [Sulfuricurvum sp. GWF2_44_89]|uniref:Uncharacterized protein n=1 Tax=Sulfuricurvum kujiense TaxID=148813 RepID=A0A2D3WJ35_9BACT|nr:MULTISPECIES: hypothetical protein [Sulfuricurvum]OHD77486.1 MAG: hypothetical protein A2023_00095 [Sulfuricurvum sp. GWF2_44_89]OHD95158.1 MAG: hypothetical protein A2517_11270 [Sulfuricurvum sp. RIFOXYD12_FULL_44_77]OHD99722.1 MAG: hypothetical protein A2552_09870 [Sulfuricurvum sp. RIFOXYD2_FULL_44_160]DAB37724.1 MAG TPA: hypothetical protein CFH83_09685 [Sulfuricurvum kujiense]
MDLQRVERELKKRLLYPYNWGRKQSDLWDFNTNFIYTTYSFESLLKQTAGFPQALRDYALNRWYNYWSAMAAEYIFASHENVEPNRNSFDKLVDFKINNIPFDHKTSVFPKGFNHPFSYSKEHTKELITWLYENQSQEGRKHLKNRLFIVMYDGSTLQHWKMKSEILQLKSAIDVYVDSFSAKNLCRLDFGSGEVLSDTIWITKGV